jgi:hypothetical protein
MEAKITELVTAFKRLLRGPIHLAWMVRKIPLRKPTRRIHVVLTKRPHLETVHPDATISDNIS